MGICVITGGTTGIGQAVKMSLQKQGHEVLNIDYKGGDVLADLSTEKGCHDAIQETIKRYPEGIDMLICNAGVGPMVPAASIFAINFFGVVSVAEGLRELLKKKQGSCVVTSSNSISHDTVRCDWVDMLTDVMDRDRALSYAVKIPPELQNSAYSSSKHAIARWVRRVSPSWAVDGLRINAVAPGNTTTPMTQGLTDEQMEAALLIPIPTRYGRKEFLDAQEIAGPIVFLASKEASGINGAVLFVDGGIDALLRSERF